MSAGASKYKLRFAAVKNKFGAGVVRYKLGLGFRARAWGRETQIPQVSPENNDLQFDLFKAALNEAIERHAPIKQ